MNQTGPWDFHGKTIWGDSPLFYKVDPCPMWFYRDQLRTRKWISAGEEPGREAYLMIMLHLEKDSRVTDYVRRFLPLLKSDYADLRVLGRTFRLDNVFLFAETVAGYREVALAGRHEALNISFAKHLFETPLLAVNVNAGSPASLSA